VTKVIEGRKTKIIGNELRTAIIVDLFVVCTMTMFQKLLLCFRMYTRIDEGNSKTLQQVYLLPLNDAAITGRRFDQFFVFNIYL